MDIKPTEPVEVPKGVYSNPEKNAEATREDGWPTMWELYMMFCEAFGKDGPRKFNEMVMQPMQVAMQELLETMEDQGMREKLQELLHSQTEGS